MMGWSPDELLDLPLVELGWWLEALQESRRYG